MPLSERKNLILDTIIKEYLKTAQPVSSGVLTEKYKLGVSPATVRNEMMELENEGFIHQPHTSAGRIPTSGAYEFHVSGLRIKPLKGPLCEVLKNTLSSEDNAYRKTAKAIAEISQGAVFWAFHKNDIYYTGLSNLFSQPEFQRMNVVYDISKVIDRMEEIIDGLFDNFPAGRRVLIGENNPFGDFLSVSLCKYYDHNHPGIFGIIGPLRMDYEKNVALTDYILEHFS